MQGWGDMADVEPPSPMVQMFESRYQWAPAQEPLHRLSESPNAIHHRLFNPRITREEIDKKRTAPREPLAKGAGLGLTFAKELYDRTHVPIGLVPCAHGGTSMDQWNPVRRDEGGDSLYGSMYDRFKAVGGRVKGVLWYQGESDANPKAQPEYRGKMKRFIEAVRKDFNEPKLPFYLVQLSRVTIPTFADAPWNGVQEDQRRLAREIPDVAVVPAIDLDLDDVIHIGTPGLKRLGRRMAIVADRELFRNDKIDIGPQLKSVMLEKPGLIRVSYEHVTGSLAPPVHIAGFSLRTGDDKPGPEFYDCRVDPEQRSSVLCQFAGDLPAGAMLWYGHGRAPYCNLTDTQDMAAPVFGAVPVTVPATKP
jgi:sialate O-acetylesterase